MKILSTLFELLMAFFATLFTTVIYFTVSRYTAARHIGGNVIQDITALISVYPSQSIYLTSMLPSPY